MMIGNEFVRYSLLLEQLSMALFGLLVAARRGVTFLSVMVNGIQSTNALQNSRSMEFSKKIFHELRIEADLQDISIDSTSL